MLIIQLMIAGTLIISYLSCYYNSFKTVIGIYIIKR